MLGSGGLFIVLTVGAGGAAPSPPSLDVPRLEFAAARSHGGDGTAALRLREPSLDGRNAQRSRTPAPAAAAEAPAAAPAAGGDTAPAEGVAAPAAEPPAEEEPSIDLLRQRAQMTRTHRALGITTWASMGVTVALGTLVAFNRPTAFGGGLCGSADGYSVFGDFGCNGGLTGVHHISSLITMGLYAVTGVLAVAMPDPERASSGGDTRAARLRIHRAMAITHFIGMILTPLLGVVSVIPAAVGVPASSQGDFSAAMRTVHLGVGYVTFAALTTAMIVEL